MQRQLMPPWVLQPLQQRRLHLLPGLLPGRHSQRSHLLLQLRLLWRLPHQALLLHLVPGRPLQGAQ